MILLWCLCGFTTAFCIGRYNQSNKLFWTLFTSFVLGIAGASVYNKYTQTTKEEIRTTQVCPTQDCTATNTVLVTIDAGIAVCNYLSAPVGQGILPECSSKMHGSVGASSPAEPPPRNA